MFRNVSGGVWFFPRKDFCTNLNYATNKLLYSADFEEWSTNGNSKRLAPNILGGW